MSFLSLLFFFPSISDDDSARSKLSKETEKTMTGPAPALAAYRNLLRAASQGEEIVVG